MTKKELYQIIKVSLPPKKYIVDELLKIHGHEVLRLPPYHCQNSDSDSTEFETDTESDSVMSDLMDFSD
ncbi:unnamed protein product [Euphydryas editha]|uniref:Uncharacterized protein n=1 Tax=Euphydryas editha TaxID=104508 RepID=A0AAU9U8B3_EUPED|nr:unnamed protein product [Euphydryas editha]